jgi:predicted P-loop ATPase
MTGKIDFGAIRADNPIDETIGRYLELRRRGREYVGLCPFHADRNPSFCVVPSKQRAFCMACGWDGDVLDFVAEFDQVDTAEAARRLGARELPSVRPALPKLPPDDSAEWTPVLPVPDDAPAFDPTKVYNPRRTKSVDWSRILVRQDAYRDAGGRLLGYVMRLEINGEKLTPAVTFCAHADGRKRWAAVKFPEPRPLQGLDELARRPAITPVLIVSGEKCREAAAKLLPGFVVVTWPGGDGAVDKADWTPLQGRSLTFWPDADPSGIRAMHAAAARALGASTRILDPSDLVTEYGKGADVADLLAAGWTAARVVAWAKQRVREWTPEQEPPEAEAAPAPGGRDRGDHAARPPRGKDVPPAPAAAQHDSPSDAPSATATEPARPARPPAAVEKRVEGTVVDLPQPGAAYSTLVNWSELGLELSDKGTPHPNLDNAAALLERHPDTQGRFWYDEFLQRILSTWNAAGEPREWTDTDDVRLALWMQRRIKIGRMAVGTARDAVTAIAMAHTRNECREWMDALRWDGTPRLHLLLPAGFGTEANAYTEAVGRCWLISMVARVFSPGCKVDTMPVFEGAQGRGKSTALQTLVGARWFAEASESPTNKDFFQALGGKLLVEIGEMDAFSRAEVHTIKRVISCQTDRYRAPYGRRAEDHPRMGVFGGTTNKDDWNRDDTGARRFWPAACTTVDLGWIARHREQLFAEAVVLYRDGTPWWDVPDEDAKREQEARRQGDAWEPIVHAYLVGKWQTTIGDVLEDALKMPPDKWDRVAQMRAGSVLSVLGWQKRDARRGGRVVKVWFSPEGEGSDELPL